VRLFSLSAADPVNECFVSHLPGGSKSCQPNGHMSCVQ